VQGKVYAKQLYDQSSNVRIFLEKLFW